MVYVCLYVRPGSSHIFTPSFSALLHSCFFGIRFMPRLAMPLMLRLDRTRNATYRRFLVLVSFRAHLFSQHEMASMLARRRHGTLWRSTHTAPNQRRQAAGDGRRQRALPQQSREAREPHPCGALSERQRERGFAGKWLPHHRKRARSQCSRLPHATTPTGTLQPATNQSSPHAGGEWRHLRRVSKDVAQQAARRRGWQMGRGRHHMQPVAKGRRFANVPGRAIE